MASAKKVHKVVRVLGSRVQVRVSQFVPDYTDVSFLAFAMRLMVLPLTRWPSDEYMTLNGGGHHVVNTEYLLMTQSSLHGSKLLTGICELRTSQRSVWLGIADPLWRRACPTRLRESSTKVSESRYAYRKANMSPQLDCSRGDFSPSWQRISSPATCSTLWSSPFSLPLLPRSSKPSHCRESLIPNPGYYMLLCRAQGS
jgi:hypothetical protein